MHLTSPTSPAHVGVSSDIMKKEFFSILLGVVDGYFRRRVYRILTAQNGSAVGLGHGGFLDSSRHDVMHDAWTNEAGPSGRGAIPRIR